MAINISPVNMDDRRSIGVQPGDTVRVWQKIQEKGKTRLQAFEGLVLARKHGNEPGATFTVRRVTGSVGVGKVFPLYSPMIDRIEIVKRSKVRRAKLYYIREKAARAARKKMKQMRVVGEIGLEEQGEKVEAEEEKKEDVKEEETSETKKKEEEK